MTEMQKLRMKGELTVLVENESGSAATRKMEGNLSAEEAKPKHQLHMIGFLAGDATYYAVRLAKVEMGCDTRELMEGMLAKCYPEFMERGKEMVRERSVL